MPPILLVGVDRFWCHSCWSWGSFYSAIITLHCLLRGRYAVKFLSESDRVSLSSRRAVLSGVPHGSHFFEGQNIKYVTVLRECHIFKGTFENVTALTNPYIWHTLNTVTYHHKCYIPSKPWHSLNSIYLTYPQNFDIPHKQIPLNY